MIDLDIIVPVRNEADNVTELVLRMSKAMLKAGIDYRIIFVVDPSTDETELKLRELSKHYPIVLHKKQGKVGKAWSILEGAQLATAPTLAMIDGDLQYPPEALPELYSKHADFGLVIANRKSHKTNLIRKLASQLNRLISNRLLLGLDYDVQSGLKLFSREIIECVDKNLVGSWSLDASLVYTALDLGHKIGSVDIAFEKRRFGKTTLNLFSATIDIVVNSLRVRLLRKSTFRLPPQEKNSQMGAGIVYKRRRFLTHTLLSKDELALSTLVGWQKVFLGAFLGGILVSFAMNPLGTGIGVVAILTCVYFLDAVFSFLVILRSLSHPPEIQLSKADIEQIKDSDLPKYSILCPLYREANVLAGFVKSVSEIDYPKNKLEVILLLEEDDQETVSVATSMNLPSFFKIVTVPDGLPKTKPKACNYGLNIASGEYVVIYDAEDRPEHDQLKKAVLAFSKAEPGVACLQAKLNYYNPDDNLLTKFFTAEYSLWFDVILPGFQSIRTSIPLGGTSNHFKTATLRTINGWDPFNVTEDCDLGVRLFKYGYKTEIFDSTTWEEANSHLGNWLRQRSRWIKGYLQTFLVHMRNPIKLASNFGWHFLVFQLVIGARITFMLINPILWLATFSYFAFYSAVGPTIESLFPTQIYYLGVITMVAGNFLYLFSYMIGCFKRGYWSLVKFVYLIPFYWVLVSLASVKAFYQLLTRPHYWEKTNHGLSTGANVKELRLPHFLGVKTWLEKEAGFQMGSLGFYLAASMVTNVVNFLYGAFLTRSGGNLKYEDLGTIGLLTSLMTVSQIFVAGLSKTVIHRSAFLFGKYGSSIREYWSKTRRKVLVLSLVQMTFWLALTPFLSVFFNTGNILPMLTFTPVWLFITVGSVDDGFLTGNFRYKELGVMVLSEAVFKFAFTYLLVNFHLESFTFVAVPSAMGITFLFGYLFVRALPAGKVEKAIDRQNDFAFPKKFFLTSIVTRLSAVSFTSFDLILVKHFLSAEQAGQYFVLSIIGKIVYYLGSLFNQFVVPIVSRHEGAGKSSQRIFAILILSTTLVVLFGIAVIGILGSVTVPLIFGAKSLPIIRYLFPYTIAMACLSIGSGIIAYHQSRKSFAPGTVTFFATIFLSVGIFLFHKDLDEIIKVLVSSASLFLLLALVFHQLEGRLGFVKANLSDLAKLFRTKEQLSPDNKGFRILIFNWRDTKHVWAGGAETYLHELSKRWVKSGCEVTVFCSNDKRNSSEETIDGVKIIRRGGFYSVYFHAFLHYLFHLRGRLDAVIDSENGVPFFTPLFVKEIKFLLIHHVHQSFFRNNPKFPISHFASFLESTLMPLVYRGVRVITVSDSSRLEIVEKGLSKAENIFIVNPGVEAVEVGNVAKTLYPSLIYLGRLKKWKNVDVAIRAFANLLLVFPESRLTIAGSGEEEAELRKLASDLRIASKVDFLGRVSEAEKIRLFSRSWIALQPSSIEGWGITVIEANSCKTPVIASNVSGLRDSIVHQKTGLLVPEKNVELLANAMRLLVSTPNYRRSLTQNAHSWSLKFSWENSASEALTHIKENYALARSRSFIRRFTGILNPALRSLSI